MALVKLYLVSRTDHVGCDEYDAMVVAANSEEEALTIQPSPRGNGWGWVAHVQLDELKVQCIGTAARGTKAGTIILSSFNAG